MGIIIVYDVTDRDTAENVSRWVEECQRYANEDIVIVVVGTKSDMKDGAVDYVSIDDMKTKEALSDVVEGFFEVSAKTGRVPVPTPLKVVLLGGDGDPDDER
nr:hypothetical protein BaRGS_024176 [Batillaria attramentaria]